MADSFLVCTRYQVCLKTCCRREATKCASYTVANYFRFISLYRTYPAQVTAV